MWLFGYYHAVVNATACSKRGHNGGKTVLALRPVCRVLLTLPTFSAALLHGSGALSVCSFKSEFNLHFALHFLALDHFARGIHEVGLGDIVAVIANSEHARLRADVAHVRAIEAVGELDDGLPVDLALAADGACVNFEDFQPPRVVGQRNFDLAVEAARPHECRVEDVRAVRSHDDLDRAQALKAVELREQLHERALDFAVRG